MANPGSFTNSSAGFCAVAVEEITNAPIVLTKGAQSFMKIDPAWQLARLADQKMLGEKASVAPTATSNYQTPTPAAKP